MAILNRRTRKGVFEISSSNGLITIYALRRARGEGGKPDPKLKALLADHAQKLKEQQQMAKLESSANSYASSPVSSPKQNRHRRSPVSFDVQVGGGSHMHALEKRFVTPAQQKIKFKNFDEG